MASRFRIVLRTKTVSDERNTTHTQAPLRRLPHIFSALLLTTIVMGILVVVLALGAVIATLVWIAMLGVIAGVIVRAAVRGPHR